MIKENDTYLEEEIDLRELFKIIWDRKVFIIVFTLVVTIIAGLYTYLKIPIFEVKSHVELGYINKEKLEDRRLVAEVALNDQYLACKRPFFSVVPL